MATRVAGVVVVAVAVPKLGLLTRTTAMTTTTMTAMTTMMPRVISNRTSRRMGKDTSGR
jgi:hypothetical protein